MIGQDQRTMVIKIISKNNCFNTKIWAEEKKNGPDQRNKVQSHSSTYSPSLALCYSEVYYITPAYNTKTFCKIWLTFSKNNLHCNPLNPCCKTVHIKFRHEIFKFTPQLNNFKDSFHNKSNGDGTQIQFPAGKDCNWLMENVLVLSPCLLRPTHAETVLKANYKLNPLKGW